MLRRVGQDFEFALGVHIRNHRRELEFVKGQDGGVNYVGNRIDDPNQKLLAIASAG